MAKKHSTSIQYQLTNKVLFDNIFLRWNEFNDSLVKGPIYMRTYFVEQWNKLKDFLQSKNLEDVEIKDIDRVVSEEDFDAQMVTLKNEDVVFFFTFPDYEDYIDYNDGFVDPVSKYVALALSDDIPRYFTLEYSKDYTSGDPRYVIGEFYIDGNELAHRNFGSIENKSLEEFAVLVCQYLESQSKNENK